MKICFIYNTDWGLWQFRKGLLKDLKGAGHDIYAICPPGDFVPRLEGLGVKHMPLHVDRTGVNPLKDLALLARLYGIFKREKFDIIHSFTIKPNIYGAFAARLAGGLPFIASIEGLGYAFTPNGGGIKHKLLGRIAGFLYRRAFRNASFAVFLNRDDMEFFRMNGLVNGTKSRLIRGAGIDIEEYAPVAPEDPAVQRLRAGLSIKKDDVVITLAARLLREKGIAEFIEAARLLKAKYPGTAFLLAGGTDPGNPSAMPEKTLIEAQSEGWIKWLGHRSDMKTIFALSDVITLPSYYREGLPMVLLEAMAMEKPIVTTDNVGCRDVVEEGRNGFMVPMNEPEALSEKLELLIRDRKMRVLFGRRGRLKAIFEFNQEMVNRETESLYLEAAGRPGHN